MSPPDSEDLRHLRRALSLAERGRFGVSPNPRVGSVVVRDGEVVGEGWHRRVGGPHAEREALAKAGERARGATLYVTLEPCNHHGRTPPCADAVIEAGVARVVACHRDPNPPAGGGFERLRRAGVAVEHGFLIERAVKLNLPFLTAAVHGRPGITLKWAMSLDGKIATAAGDSRWISSPASLRWSLELREEHDAILVGVGTALADDPRLTRRLGRASGPILRVVLDRRLRLPPEGALLAESGPVLVYARSPSEPDAAGHAARRRALEKRGAEVVELAEVEPAAVAADLYSRGVSSLLVEGGGEIHASFVGAGVYDRVRAVVAPVLIGGRAAPGPLGGRGRERLADCPRLESVEVARRGPDVIVTGYRPGCLPELFASVGG